ncbi:MAG: IPT/TIG domain-containing protein [Burkholderiaceae bacterium]
MAALLARLGRAARALAISAPFALVSACGGGGGSDGTFSLSTHQISFAAARPTSDAIPNPEVVQATVTGVTSGTLYIRVEVVGDAVTVGNITVTGTTTGQAVIQPVSPEILGPGDHRATVTVYACTTSIECTSGQLAGSPQRIEVDYKVTGLALSEQALAYAIGNTVTPADMSKDVQVIGYPEANWTMTSDADWLLPSRKAGDTGESATLTASLDPDVVESLANGVYHGAVTLTPATGEPVTVSATLTIDRTEVRLVSPGTELAGSAMEVIVRGDNFDKVTVTGVRFGDVASTAFRVVSPTEIRATHPALPAGTYPVTVEDSQHLVRNLSSLSVVAAPVMSTAAFATPPAAPGWYPRAVVYDAPRQALLVGLLLNDGSGQSAILRYTYNGATWQGPTQVTTDGGMTSLSLTMDGKQLLMGLSGAIVRHLDPVTLTVLNTSAAGGAYFEELTSMPLTSDGYIIGGMGSPSASGYQSVTKYSIRETAFVDLPEGVNMLQDDGAAVASADGSTVLIGNTGPYGRGFVRYDASTGIFTPLDVAAQAYGMASDRTGSRFVVGNVGIYDRNLTLLGSLPDGMTTVVMSRDGSRVYALDWDRKLWRFELGYVGGAFSVVQMAAPATLVQDPSPNDGFAHYPVNMTLSPDGGTLFISGTKFTIVMPAN